MTISNLDRYKKDFEALLQKGEKLLLAIKAECHPKEFRDAYKKAFGDKSESMFKRIPSFRDSYQAWYSEARAIIKQLLPDRLSDFASYYERPKARKEINYESYRILDYLQSLDVTRQSGMQREKVVGPEAAIPQFQQQLAILESVKARFESSLFDIRQLVQADLFDSELDAAAHLAHNKFRRGAGAMTGVVLERHLGQVCENHSISISKKNPTIADYNEALKKAEVIDTPEWRRIQHLADLRNLCDHDKKKEPTTSQVDDLISGVRKTIETLF